MEHRSAPVLHFRAFHIALMVEAEPYLSSVTRVQSLKGDTVEPQISSLLRLYQRQPGQPSSPTPSISIPTNHETLCAKLEQSNNPSARILTAVPSSPPLVDATPSTLFAKVGPGLTSSSTPTVVSSQPDDTDVDLCADIQLAEYIKEPSVSTWEDLKNTVVWR